MHVAQRTNARRSYVRQNVGEELSGRMLDLRSMGCWFETHRRHCVVFLSNTRYVCPLLSTGSMNRPGMTETNVDWGKASTETKCLICGLKHCLLP